MRLRSICIRIRRVLSEPLITLIFVMGCDCTAASPLWIPAFAGMTVDLNPLQFPLGHQVGGFCSS